MNQFLAAHRKTIALSLLYIYAGWLLMQLFVGKFGLDGFSKARFDDSIAAVAYRPYVYRALVPAIVRTVSGVVPNGVGKVIRGMFQGPDVLPAMAANYSLDYVLFCVLTWGCLVGFAYCMRWLVRRFYPDYPGWIADIAAPFGAMAMLPLFFRHVNFVYDPATIVLFPVALICLLQEKYLLYVLMVALCALNKETAILLVPVFVWQAYHRRMNVFLIGVLAALQAGACVGIYLYIKHSMQDRPGVPTEPQLFAYNLVLPIHQPYAFVWFVVVVGALVRAVTLDWRTKPVLLRQLFLIMMVPHTAILMVVGCIDEIRVYYEVYALLFLLMLPTLVQQGRSLTERTAPEVVAQ